MSSDRVAAIAASHHVLAVHDVASTAAWWIDRMGFDLWAEPEGWVFVRRGGCAIMLGQCPEAIAPAALGDHQYFAYVVVDDVDAYHAEVAARGVDVLAGPADTPWGMREMAVRTPDGHRVMFAEEMSGA
ncbi:MAG: VOC family protein [Alphaproteobacteria bacterium]